MSSASRALSTTVFGVDVQSGDVRGDRPSYALVRLAYDETETVERDVVSRRKLLRLVAEAEPDRLATDNMYELAADKAALVELLRRLPAGTRLVQVTGDEQPEPLSRVAARHGVPYGKDPMEEAEAAARLAAANVGQEVSAFADRTDVKVARGRTTGGGGWSEDRLTRRIHGNVKRVAREVEADLDAAGLDYEREVTEKYGGFANAVFSVAAAPDGIPVSERRSGDVRVEVERERRDGIVFEPLVKRRDHVVVGVDPGTTTAVGVVSLDGEVLDAWSSRTADTAAVIERIVDGGRPIVVAADVTPIPETVEKIRRSFDAAAWEPESDLPVDQKKHRTREAPVDDDHQRDALTAALFAHDDHADQFRRVAEKVPPGVDRGEVTARVVAGEESVEAVLRDLRDDGDDESADAEHEPRELSPEEERVRDLERQVDRLQSHVETLEERLEERDATIEEYETELSSAHREERLEAKRNREVRRLERKTETLERQRDRARERASDLEGKLDRLKALWRLDHSNFSDVDGEAADLVPVKPVDQFTSAAIEAADESYGLIAEDVVLLRDASGAGHSTARRLADTDPRIVLLGDGGLSDAADEVLFEAGVPVGPADEVTIREVDDLAVARESEVEAVVADWEERAERRRRERTAEMVDRIVSEHRASGSERATGGSE